jgi:hypothetical protein
LRMRSGWSAATLDHGAARPSDQVGLLAAERIPQRQQVEIKEANSPRRRLRAPWPRKS